MPCGPAARDRPGELRHMAARAPVPGRRHPRQSDTNEGDCMQANANGERWGQVEYELISRAAWAVALAPARARTWRMSHGVKEQVVFFGCRAVDPTNLLGAPPPPWPEVDRH